MSEPSTGRARAVWSLLGRFGACCLAGVNKVCSFIRLGCPLDDPLIVHGDSKGWDEVAEASLSIDLLINGGRLIQTHSLVGDVVGVCCAIDLELGGQDPARCFAPDVQPMSIKRELHLEFRSEQISVDLSIEQRG